ncbi:response regulator [Paenibacillus sacheonensis]|uniref:Response regulator n=1 Tax=Paenibacillus sacheonensis TaxID=742054 RepID=A0A7X4YTY9_9BACL|nr:response regulator [Paenibacillus sacheonensis]MBM7568812.1 two-component system response regulator YesN [Paenibacillus sacheonensis]NBC72518.1 response regulator [Paenibacillus sacheonensis]
MYNVLLVDDENLVIKSLEAGVDWSRSGFRVAGKANNGAKALQLVADLKPHIVFTDIRMPGMSGLELIKSIKTLDPDIQIVVISGYAEFAYVQKSLNYGVLGYCLKPFDDYEIETLLRTAAKTIGEIKLKRESHLLELMDDQPTETSRDAFLQILSDAGLLADTVHVAVAIGKGRLTFPAGTKTISFHLGSARCGYFVQYPDGGPAADLLGAPVPEGILGIGIVRSERDMGAMIRTIEQATARAWDFFIQGRNDCYGEREECGDGDSGEEKANGLVRSLEQAISKKNAALLLTLLGDMLLPANKRCLRIHHALKIYNIVYFHVSYGRVNSPEDDYIFSKEQLFHLYRGFDAMIGSLIELLRDTGGSSPIREENRTEHANLKEIVKHIQEQYRTDISIQSISKRFFMNANYLSQLFKREMKVTFTDYLTKVRIQQAKVLLRDSGLSIGEVAEHVGFRDYFYFIRTFKKHARLTPRQYRLQEKSDSGGAAPVREAEER